MAKQKTVPTPEPSYLRSHRCPMGRRGQVDRSRRTSRRRWSIYVDHGLVANTLIRYMVGCGTSTIPYRYILECRPYRAPYLLRRYDWSTRESHRYTRTHCQGGEWTPRITSKGLSRTKPHGPGVLVYYIIDIIPIWIQVPQQCLQSPSQRVCGSLYMSIIVPKGLSPSRRDVSFPSNDSADVALQAFVNVADAWVACGSRRGHGGSLATSETRSESARTSGG